MQLNEDFHFDEFAERHEDFLRSLQDFPLKTLDRVDLRAYQEEGIAKFRSDLLSGQTKGQFILGTGGGKTTIAKAIIAGTRGKTLYVGPSRTSAEQGKTEFDKRGIDKSCQVLNPENPFRKFDPNAEVTYGTAQMFIHADRYRDIDPDHFDLVIFDEAHHFLGRKFGGLSTHFNAAQLFMTATPGNMRTHLNSLAPHKYFEFGSNDLIDQEGFPVWRVYRHEVSDEHFERAKVVGDKFQLEGNEANVLNLPHRFAIARDLFLKSVAKGERRLAFMPSVASSREFISAVVEGIPALRGKVVHVDGSTKNVGEVLKAFKRGEILGVCCKDLWNESLDIPEISAITLADPSCSERVILQRIGRGARPAAGKKSLRIDDVVSCIPNMNYSSGGQNEQGSGSGRRPLTVHGILGLKKYSPGAHVNGPEAAAIYRDVTKYESIEIPFNERHLSEDMAFIRNPRLGAALMQEFARVFGTSIVNLFTQPKIFYNRREKVTIETHDGESFDLDFEDAYKAATLFGSIRRIEAEVLRGISATRKAMAEKVKEVFSEGKKPEEKIKQSAGKFDFSKLSPELITDENRPALEKAEAFMNLKFDDEDLNFMWTFILIQTRFGRIEPLTPEFFDALNNNLAEIVCRRIGGSKIELSNDKGLFPAKYVVLRKLELELKKIGIEIKFEFGEKNAYIGQYPMVYVSELNLKHFNPKKAKEKMAKKDKAPTCIRDIYFDSISPEYLAKETESHIKENVEVSYDLILKLAEAVLEKFREKDQFEIPVAEFPDPVCEEIFAKLMVDLEGNMGMLDKKYEFEKVDDKYKFRFTPPDEERMQNWNRGRLKYEALREISFEKDVGANILWHKLMNEFAGLNYTEFQFFDDFEKIWENASNVTLEVSPGNDAMLEIMRKKLAEYGIVFQIRVGENGQVKGKYWFAINVDNMKIPEVSIPAFPSRNVSEVKESDPVLIGKIKWQILDSIDYNYFEHALKEKCKEKGFSTASMARIFSLVFERSVVPRHAKDFQESVQKGIAVKEEFFISDEDLKVTNPEEYLTLILCELDIGPLEFYLDFRKVEGGFECAWISPDDEIMLDWDENRRIWDMLNGIRFDISKNKKENVVINSLWADIWQAFIHREVYTKHAIFGCFKGIITEVVEDEEMVPKIPASEKNKVALEKIKIALAKFKIAFSFEISEDGKILSPKFDMSETVPLNGLNKLPNGINFIPAGDPLESRGLWQVRC